jgi:hypothetical protein
VSFLSPRSRDVLTIDRQGHGSEVPPINDFRKLHTAHCIDTLRQKLMCHADLGVVPWTNPTDRAGFLDFGRREQCRNFQEVAKFSREHEYVRMQMPEDAYFKGHDVPYYSWSGHD